MQVGSVRWKPLYYTSIAMFALSVILYPIDASWSIIVALALVGLWSRTPGFMLFFLDKLAFTDTFTLIIGAQAGWLIGGLFGVFVLLFGRLFGPKEWIPLVVRSAIATFIAAYFLPMILAYTGGVNIMSIYLFNAVTYSVYYGLVLLFWREEIALEIAILPAILFFDFGMNSVLIGPLDGLLSAMMSGGLGAGWPFVILSGLILGFLALAKNARKVAALAEQVKDKLGGRTEKERAGALEEFLGLGAEK